MIYIFSQHNFLSSLSAFTISEPSSHHTLNRRFLFFLSSFHIHFSPYKYYTNINQYSIHSLSFHFLFTIPFFYLPHPPSSLRNPNYFVNSRKRRCSSVAILPIENALIWEVVVQRKEIERISLNKRDWNGIDACGCVSRTLLHFGFRFFFCLSIRFYLISCCSWFLNNYNFL